METPLIDYSSFVDTSRPFRSVKEAVAIFGERILAGGIYSSRYSYPPPTPTQDGSWMFSAPTTPLISPVNPSKAYDDHHEYSSSNGNEFMDSLKKLEAELEQTKVELKLLKERESETEVAVASLNAELHKNMSKLAEKEAEAAGRKATAAMARRVSFEMEKKEDILREKEKEEEEKKNMQKKKTNREMVIRMENSTTLAHVLSLGEEKGYTNYGGKKEKKMKKKPIIPLVGDFFFFRKKGSSNKNTLNNNPLFLSSHGVF